MSAPDVKLIATSSLSGTRANPIQVMKMADAFSSLGCAVEVILPGWGRPHSSLRLASRFGIRHDFRIVYLPNAAVRKKLGILSFAFSVLGRSLGWKRSDILITRSERAASLLARVGKNVLYENHTFAFPGEAVTARYRRRVGKLMGRPSVAMIAISARLKELWTQFGVDAGKVLVAHDGVDLEEFRRVLSIPKAAARRELGLPPDPPLIGYTGSLGADRGITAILEAAAAYENRGYLFLIVGGNESEVKEYRRRARGSNVIFAGHVDNARIPLHLACADLLVMPYQKSVVTIDGCSPMKVFEYLASGKPILAPYFASYHEVLKDFPGVTFYGPEDQSRFISEIGSILEDPSRRAPLDRLSRMEGLSWRRRAEALLEFHAQRFPDENR